MKKISNFTNRYSLSKTLKFKLVPEGKTLENFNARFLLEKDQELASLYTKVKGYIDEYHKAYIESSLGTLSLDISEYADLFYKENKDEKDKKVFDDISTSLRKQISKSLKSSDVYSKLNKKELITELLPNFFMDEECKSDVSKFNKFTTYFTGFNKNRENLYSDEEKSTSVAYRCINDNLPKFLINRKSYNAFVEVMGEETLSVLNAEYRDIIGLDISDIFVDIKRFNFVLTQKGITGYNNVIGGYTTTNGKKIKGINEYINEFNQKHENQKLARLKPLFKQMLSDLGSISFLPERFESDDEVISKISSYYDGYVCDVVEETDALISKLEEYNYDGIYYNKDNLSALSNALMGSWHSIKEAWENRYDIENGERVKQKNEKYYETRDKAWEKISVFSLSEIEGYVGSELYGYFNTQLKSISEKIKATHSAAEKILNAPYTEAKSLAQNDSAITLLKNLLDAIKELERFIKAFACDAFEGRDEVFYGDFEKIHKSLTTFSPLYDKVRNYVTAKPYSDEKIKINFENPQFLSGWDKNKEKDYRSVLLRRGENYYLAVMDKSNNKLFESYPSEAANEWEKMECKFLPGPNKMLPKVFFGASNIKFYAPSEEILRIYKKDQSFKKGPSFSLDDCHALIDFYKSSIKRHEEWCKYGFVFKDTEDYSDISEFYNDVADQGFSMSFKPISEKYIFDSIDAGKLYLFRIYSKDFSQYSKGNPNLHTLYFKMLFDERNLADLVYKLNGGAEMFYRLPSINNAKVTHPKNLPIENKNPHSEKRYSTFDYDLIKDKRYTQAQFSLHLPITLNFKAIGKSVVNDDVRRAIKKCENNYVIGIDRGERHLIYVTVVDERGTIVEQHSLNQIINSYNQAQHTVDYHKLLETREGERMESRRSWKQINSIKELKEGYVSQVVHKICELVVKYDALIAMEDLNFGFKTSRCKVEMQVYQKFEKMLIDKLNFLAYKNVDPEKEGGLFNAYQLTEKFESFAKMGKQNGFIFYVPAWLTSKIDPTTGFVDLMKPKYKSIEESKKFVEKFRQIRFNKTEGYYEFLFDYRDFPKGDTDSRGLWRLCTYGERIHAHRDVDGGHYVNETVNLTEAFSELFASAGINVEKADIKSDIVACNDKSFFEKFMYLMRLSLQLRNSVSGAEIDYLISPVKNSSGAFYDSRNYDDCSNLPANADANGAYNIARKALFAIRKIKNTEETELRKLNLSISNKEWLQFAQANE